MKLINRKLFTKYSKFDSDIINKASSCGLPIIGGTAIEIWLTHYNLKGWRSRSQNDLDFIADMTKSSTKKSEIEFRDWVQMYTDDTKVKIDIFETHTAVNPNIIRTIGGILVIHPAFIICSKVNRMTTLKPSDERYIKDKKDIWDLFKLLDQNPDEFEILEGYVNSKNCILDGTKQYNFLSELITEYMNNI